MRLAAAFAGFLLLGLSPSFIDWGENPSRRGEMVAYYAAALLLIYLGVLA